MARATRVTIQANISSDGSRAGAYAPILFGQGMKNSGEAQSSVGTGVTGLISLTQAEYDAIAVKDSSLLYVIVG